MQRSSSSQVITAANLQIESAQQARAGRERSQRATAAERQMQTSLELMPQPLMTMCEHRHQGEQKLQVEHTGQNELILRTLRPEQA